MKAELLIVSAWAIPLAIYVYRHRIAETWGSRWIVGAKALGLRLERRTIPVVGAGFDVCVGVRDGVPVEVWTGFDGDERWICAQARLSRPLLIGLHATTRPSDPVSELAGPRLAHLDLPGWTVHAHDAERASDLLGRLRRTLRRYPDDGHDLTLDEQRVTLHARSEPTRAEIAALLDEAIAVARRAGEALALLGSADWQRTAAKEWAEVAAREGFSCDPDALRIHGGTDRLEVDASVEVTNALQTKLCFTLRAPARGRVVLGRGGSDAGPLLAIVGQVATPSGDRSFDARFAASAPSRQDAAALLDDDAVRAALLELPDPIWGGDIAGTAVTLRADGALSGEALGAALRAADRLAVTLARPRGGGYRAPS